MEKPESTEIEESSGNVFADLGFPDAEEHYAKAKLVLAIDRAIRAIGLSERDAANAMGIEPSELQNLLVGHFREYSGDRLLVFLNRLGQDVIT